MTYTATDLERAITDVALGDGFDHTYVPWNSSTPTTVRSSGWSELVEALFWTDSSVTVPGIGDLAGVENHGGHEGAGEERWMVFSVTDSDGSERTFRKSGWYGSYVGTEWGGDFEEVKPAEKTIRVWEATK
jgi:hypothetical protein